MTMPPEIAAAMWAGDQDELWRIAPCICCCHEHTFEHCPARAWEGCRGSGAPTHADLEAWAKHYGMPLFDFLDPYRR